MEPPNMVGTAPETVLHLRDLVRPLIVKMVAKRAATYPDLLTADDRDDLVASLWRSTTGSGDAAKALTTSACG